MFTEREIDMTVECEVSNISPKQPPQPDRWRDDRRDERSKECTYLSQKFQASSTPNENGKNADRGADTPLSNENKLQLDPKATEWYPPPQIPKKTEGNADDGSTVLYTALNESASKQLTDIFQRTQQTQTILMQDLLKQQREQTMALTLPQQEVPVFSGDAIEYCESIRDYASRDLLTKLLVDTEEHIDFLETQLELIDKVGIQNYLQSQMKDLG